jgi:toxin ParE1/3/4
MVKWTDHAKGHLQEIHHYISQDSAIYATRVIDALVRKTIGIDFNPRIGHKSPELNDDLIREVHLYSYRILYQVLPDYIAVLAVIHKRRELHPDEILRDQ